jgi:nonsense-mediated mRNA decay protein 3
VNGKWAHAELESRELMSMCLKAIPGLNEKNSEIKLIDAQWVWTEPHSKRLKVKIVVQKEIMNSAILQQSAIVTFVVRNQQSPDVSAEYAEGAWQALVQVRQYVGHKRTFLYLEQLILRHRVHEKCTNIQGFRTGMDFYFNERNSAVKFADFVESVVPVRMQASKKLISADNHSNVANFKFSYVLFICTLIMCVIFALTNIYIYIHICVCVCVGCCFMIRLDLHKGTLWRLFRSVKTTSS